LIVTRTLPAFLRSEAPANVSQRTLTFAERVAYQRAIEDVYWRHRIWPKERRDPKPSLDSVMSQAQLEKKVTDYLRKSQALADYWQRPITADQLQAEMDRMAKHTRQPDVLRKLFEALGNDPFVIAECLARPALSERLLMNWYAYDQRIHGELKQRAEAELQSHPSLEQMKLSSGKYNEVVFAKSDTSREKASRGARHAILLNSREWDSTAQILSETFNKPGATNASEFGLRRHVAAFESVDISARARSVASETYESIPIGVLGPLQEDQEHYYATIVIEKTADDLKLASVSWLKEPLDSWIARAESQVPSAMPVPTASYTLPTVSEGAGCVDDTWTTTSGPPDPRAGPTAVWTGSEMIVWGGGNNLGNLNTGGRYNPATDSWTATTSTNAPTARAYHTAVWTGSEMVVWGGYDGTYLGRGVRYNRENDRW
jgi:hypothetical protein